tara:strand:- start:228 stop:668 length:441 start_codon:yes stop_codon:yes gene_type:complete
MVAKVIAEKVLKPLTKKIMDKLRKNPEDLTQAERKAVRDHARAKATTTTKDGVKIIKHPYMGKAGEVVAKRPKKSDPSPAAIEKFMKKEDAKDRALSAKRLREIRKEDRSESLTGELGFKKGGMVKKCRMDGIALRGKTRAKERSK